MSTDAAGAQADGGSYSPSISSDGQYVAFSSTAANLHPADMSPTQDVFRATNPLAIFANIGSLGMLDVADGSVAWGDYDNDGMLDILLTGDCFGSGGIAKVYHNNGDGTFTEDTSAGLTGVETGSVAWGDYDNDGGLDILLTGIHRHRAAIAKIYHNNGDGTFSREHFGGTDGGLRQFRGVGGLRQRRAARHPAYRMDTDRSRRREGLSQQRRRDLHREHLGRTDRRLARFRGVGGLRQRRPARHPAHRIHRHRAASRRSITTTATAPSPRTLRGLTGVYVSSVAWGDYDNDGRLDILLTGDDSDRAATSRRSITTTATARSPRTLGAD